MNNKIDIEELLKQELSGLNPEPPADVWQHIGSRIQPPSATPQVNPSSVATKTAALSGKVILGIAVAVTAVAGAVAVYMMKDNTTQKVALTEKMSAPVNVAEPGTVQDNEPVVENLPESPESKAKELAAPEAKKAVQQSEDRQTFAQERENAPDAIKSDPTETKRNPESPKTEQTHRPTNEHTNPAPGNQVVSPPAKSTEIPPAAHQPDEAFNKPNIPNVFTPNGDGYNDEYIITIEDELVFDLKITDGQGYTVFESRDKNEHWKGINVKTGLLCQPGIYVMVFRYQVKGMKEPRVETGLILLKQ